ncbi:SERINE/THREONINE-PROTEIN KINASE, partial [Salix purpurea]
MKVKEEIKPAQPASDEEEKKTSILKTRTGQLKEYYNLGRKLGHGQFGTTFLCVEKATGKEAPNVVSIKGAYEDAMAVHVVMELCAG